MFITVRNKLFEVTFAGFRSPRATFLHTMRGSLRWRRHWWHYWYDRYKI